MITLVLAALLVNGGEGVVTFADHGRRFFYSYDTNREITVRYTFDRGKKSPLIGEWVTTRGELNNRGGMTVYDHTIVKRGVVNPEILPPVLNRTIAELTKSPSEGGDGLKLNGRRIIVEGTVGSIEQFGKETRIELEDEQKSVTVVMISQAKCQAPDFVVPRARIRVKGCFECIYDFRILPGVATVVNPYLYVDKDGCFDLVAPPSWWTKDRILIALEILTGILIASLLWGLFLRVLVRKRTAALVKESKARMKAEIEMDAVARERLRLSYDLHDDLQQLLAGTMCRLKAGLNYLARRNEPKALAQFAFARQTVSQTQLALRHILWGLHDESKANGSLEGLFRYVAQRFADWKDIVTFSVEGESRDVSRQISGALLMIMQEAVANALKHGNASKVEVKIAYAPRGVALTISDNGCGFEVREISADAGRLGLVSMRLRAEQLGGKFSISSKPGQGSCVRVTVSEEVKK